eukprot:c22290_g1_i1.p1 GENE.c22290_g1_i1~~c22290_g1_i1.p1  ORF type:complete len:297 (+),score=75.90 c22290_g1_i1:55-891(+)
MVDLFYPETLNDALLAIFCWTLLWGLLNLIFVYVPRLLLENNKYYIKLRQTGEDWVLADRLSSCVHATIMVIVVFASAINDGIGESKDDLVDRRSPTLYAALPMSLGYFIPGSIMVIKLIPVIGWKVALIDLVHHFAACFAESVMLYGKIVPDLCRLFLLTEITTPIVHIRWILMRFEGKAFFMTIVDALLVLGFVIFRDLAFFVIIGLVIYIEPARFMERSVLVFWTTIILEIVTGILNFYWTSIIFSKCLAKYIHKPKKHHVLVEITSENNQTANP